VKSLKRFSAVDNSLSDAMLENGISQLMQFRQAAAAHAANAQATTLWNAFSSSPMLRRNKLGRFSPANLKYLV